jgi:hypothetical protein
LDIASLGNHTMPSPSIISAKHHPDEGFIFYQEYAHYQVVQAMDIIAALVPWLKAVAPFRTGHRAWLSQRL